MTFFGQERRTFRDPYNFASLKVSTRFLLLYKDWRCVGGVGGKEGEGEWREGE